MKAIMIGRKTEKHLYYNYYKHPKQDSPVQYYNSNYVSPPSPPPPPSAFIFSSGGGFL